MRVTYHVMSSPVGLLFLARTERGLRYLEFMDRKSLKRMIGTHAAALPDAVWQPSLLDLKPVVDELEAYFSGMLERFTVALDPVGSEFQLKVWSTLRQIPFGQTRTYGEVAQAIGQPRATRAVGLANNQNPIAIIVPCHRVIGADGSMVGYGGGVARKKWLLENETRFAQTELSLGDRPIESVRPRGAAVAVAKPAAGSVTTAARPAARPVHGQVAQRAMRVATGAARKATAARPASGRTASARPAGVRTSSSSGASTAQTQRRRSAARPGNRRGAR